MQNLSHLTGIQTLSTPLMKTVVLLFVSNIFMTIAWYGHLKYKHQPLMWVILISWSVALFEYIFQVPANRIGAQTFSLMQLKIMQECITLIVFSGIAYLFFGQTLKWNNLVSYTFIIGAVYFSFAF
ncbi:MAG TPA: DMT family protein [Pyrinomonadaceae bacterium]|nr:DMT family protein [Pyrinomonadaceae bacterium]